MKKTMRILSLLMVLVLCVSLAPLSAFASDEPETLAPVIDDTAEDEDAPDIMEPVAVEEEPEPAEAEETPEKPEETPAEPAKTEETETVEEPAEVEEIETAEELTAVEEAEAAEEPEEAPAADGGVSGDFTYTSEGDNATITAYTGTRSTLTIPAKIDGYSVTSIGNTAFADCDSLTSVTIPEGVTSIGDSAFAYCRGLTSVTIPEGVTSIGNFAFEGCSGLTSVTIPEGVTSIGYGVFWGCSSLMSVTIPESVTSIWMSAFRDCSSLTSVTIPESVTSIGNSAFSGCSSLTSVTIPESVTSIRHYAFYDCSSLTDISYGGTTDQWGAVSVDFGNSQLTSVTVHCTDGDVVSGTSEDYAYTLGGNKVTVTGYTGSDTILMIPAQIEGYPVTSIGSYAFWGCSSLTSVTIPEGVTSIGEYAFDACISLTSVTIPEGVTSIGDYAFGFCTSLTSVTIPASVTSIGERAFEYCEGLTSVTIPEGVTSIGNSAFEGCSGLTSVTIPASVTSIGYGVFWGCSSLMSVTIPDSVTSIDGCAFLGCSDLTDVYYGGTKEQWGDISIGDDNDPLTSATIHHNYAVIYNANGGYGAPSPQIKTRDIDLTLSTTIPTRKGYTFLGWATTNTATTAEYSAGGTYTNNADVTLYAVWKLNTYTVMFNANGGENAPDTQIKTYGRALTLTSDVPTREGYTFLGWATTNTTTTAEYSAGGTYTNNADVTLYAVWKLNTYTVTYNANGGYGVPSPQIKTHDIDLTLSTTIPTREGYTFQGWATTNTAATATYPAGGSYTANAEITFYAVWKLNTYTVTYNANGGENAPDAMIKTHGEDLTLSSSVPTREGYTFQGWATTETAITPDYMAGGAYTNNAAATLYAVWKANSYTVTYNANGGKGAPEAQTKTNDVALTLLSTEPTRTGYTFQGWATASTATTVEYSAGGSYTDNASITLYAVWEHNGDVNGSGAPDSTDLVALSKYLSGDNSEAKYPDVNNDGAYDLLDLVRLMKLLAK